MQRIGSMENLTEARHQLNRLMRAHFHGDIDTQTFRNLTYAFSVLLSFFKTELDQPKEETQEAYANFIDNVNRAMGNDQNNS